MAALITAGSSGSTGSSTVSADSQIICSGEFGSGASVEVEVSADSLRPAKLFTFEQAGACNINAKTATTITVTIKGGNASTSIDVSLI